MDATGKLKSDKGSVLVLIAAGMVVLLALTALAIDLGYMYVAKSQLQSAADAAALAGAGRLDGTNSFSQYSARNAAVRFAGKNNAANESVVISSDYSNSLSSSNDITIGHWNGTTFTPSAIPANAVEVRTRRTGDSEKGPISLFFGKAFGFSEMGAAAYAVAAREPRAGFFLFIGREVCNQTGEIDLSEHLKDTTTGNLAWTSLFDSSTSTGDMLEFFCPEEKLPNVPVCGKSIYTTGGTVSPDYRGVQIDFYDPMYDTSNKLIVDGQVIHWDVTVPVSEVADPTKQPSPARVWGYAKIRIIKVCSPGGTGANPCKKDDRTDIPKGACNDSYQRLVINQIQCVDCANSDIMVGTKPGLVQ